jgi:hypothetical protein
MIGSLLSAQLTAFSISLSAVPDADTAVAIAISLARVGRQAVEVPVSVDVVDSELPANASPQKPEDRRIEWVPTCDEHGCRLVPRILSPETPSRITRSSTSSRPHRGIRSRLRGR